MLTAAETVKLIDWALVDVEVPVGLAGDAGAEEGAGFELFAGGGGAGEGVRGQRAAAAGGRP
jgi:hypothetical protein